MDLKELMDLAGKLREQLQSVNANAQNARFTGEAGGGMVRVVLNGRHEALEVKIDKAAVDPNDLHMLEDLVRAAFNQASSQLVAGLQNQFGSLAQSLGIDPSKIDLSKLGGGQ